MARPVLVGPLRLWSTDHGTVLICEHAGARSVYPLGTLASASARGSAAWRAFRERDETAAYSFPYLPAH